MQRIGVDILAIDRMAAAVRRSGDKFLAKVFTSAEIDYCGGSPERLAGRWAAKEAIIKCFDGTGICFPRRRIEVLPAATGAPKVRLIGDGRGAHVQVSITHQAGVAVATATLDMPHAAAASEGLLPAPEAVSMPARPAGAHKGTFGTVTVVAGSLGLTGAAYLSATAAARAGAGMVRLLVADTIYPILAAKCTEVMATPVAEVAPGAIGHSALETVMRQVEASKAIAIGPGLGRDKSTWRLVYDVIARAKQPMVLDADALNALADNERALKRLGEGRVLTPHPGEMARLTGKPIADLEQDREGAARAAAAAWRAVVVLKGAHTVVAAPDGRVSVDPHEVPALATGGTGDVLSGTVAGLLAQGLDPFAAAVTAVYVHAEAGRRVAVRQGDSGLLASDLLGELPLVMDALRKGGL
jgi:ADP-dependent NAD(P)H-hydrate dehydratase / NAD(P)H-hydrate epimerase